MRGPSERPAVRRLGAGSAVRLPTQRQVASSWALNNSPAFPWAGNGSRAAKGYAPAAALRELRANRRVRAARGCGPALPPALPGKGSAPPGPAAQLGTVRAMFAGSGSCPRVAEAPGPTAAMGAGSSRRLTPAGFAGGARQSGAVPGAQLRAGAWREGWEGSARCWQRLRRREAGGWQGRAPCGAAAHAPPAGPGAVHGTRRSSACWRAWGSWGELGAVKPPSLPHGVSLLLPAVERSGACGTWCPVPVPDVGALSLLSLLFLLSPLSAVIVECCVWLCPALGSGTGSMPGTATPCAHRGNGTGERCRTDPQQGAGAGQLPTPKATTWLQMEAELLPFPGTPPGTSEPPSTEWGAQTGSEGTGPTGGHGAGTEAGPPLATGAAEAATGSQGPSPASLGRGLGGGPSAAPTELDAAPTTSSSLRTEPVGNEMAEGATTLQGILLRSPSSVTVPSSTGEQWGTPSALPGQSPMGTAPTQSQGGSRSSLHPEPGARERLGATAPLGDSSPGTHQSSAPATGSPGPGTTGTSPSVGGLQRLLSSLGTRGEAAGGRGSESHPWHGTDAAWQGPRAASHPSLPSLGAGGHGGLMWQLGDPTASTAQPAAGTGTGLPVPTAMASTPGETSPSQEGDLDLTVGVSGPPDTERPPEPRRIPLDQMWPSVAPGSTAVVPSGVPRGSPMSPQPPPATSSAAPTSPTPQPSPGLGPTTGTPPAGSPGPGLPHTGSGGHRAESPLILGMTPEKVVDGELWAATAQQSWQPGSLAPPTAPAPHLQPAPSQPASSLAATTTTSATATASPALLGDVGTVTPEPSASVWQGDAEGLTWGPSIVPGSPQQPTDSSRTLGHHGGSGSPPSPGDTDLVQPSSSPRERQDADAPRPTAEPAPAGRAPRVFIVEDQPPLLRASLLRVPCELVLDMGFVPALQDPASRERRGLLHSFNRTVAPLFMSVPGFLRLEVTGIREGSVVLEYDALFAAERVRAPGLGALLDAALGSGGARPGLAVGAAPVLRNVALERPLDPCAELFACRAGFACVAGADGNATCTSLCHRDYCKNHGICTHPRDRGPLCQCPVGSDFWFMGLRCDYRVTQQSLLGMAVGVLFSIVLLGAVVAGIVIRRFKALLLEARADQTRSSYRRFCRLDDVSAQYWSRSWLASASSLDNPAFTNSEELQVLDNGCCGCREAPAGASSHKQRPAPPARPAHRPSFHYDWDTSSSSMNDPMVDSGKASDISVSSWPMEPIPWTPFPILHHLSRQRPHKARRPHSYCEGMELVNLERSWTA